MNWILEHVQVLIAIAAAITYMISRGHAEKPDAADRPGTPAEQKQAERTRRIQEEIRRKIAERRGGGGDVPSLDPFGGPLRRMARQLEEAAAAARQPEPPPELETKAVLARQQRLAEEMRILEAARESERRRAADIARRQAAPALRSAREAVSGLAPSARATLLTDLRGPQGLRRAVLLREILGPPVGLK
jgi:hypothetical protein